MLSIKSFKRTFGLVGTIIFGGLVLAMMAQSVQAQSIASVRRAIVSMDWGQKVFVIDRAGQMGRHGEYLLEITRLNDDGSLVGKYFRFKGPIPESTNVTGSITIGGIAGGGGIAIRFTVTEPAAIGYNETVFEGAIRLGGTREIPFMAGTFTSTFVGGTGFGPLPFCAILRSTLG